MLLSVINTDGHTRLQTLYSDLSKFTSKWVQNIRRSYLVI